MATIVERKHKDGRIAYTIQVTTMNVGAQKKIRKAKTIIVLLTGIRRGELCGLEWKDIDLKNENMTIRRSRNSVRGFGVIEKKPKNDTSIRVITLPHIVIDVLNEYKKEYECNRRVLGDAWMAGDKLMVSCVGRAVYPQTINQWLNKVLKESGLPKVTVHSLRHTNITLQIMQGVPLVAVSKRAGHARASTTSDIYAYFFQSADRRAAEVLDRIFS